jgi:hypothetical protein
MSTQNNNSELHAIRRENLLLLLRDFSQARIAAGDPTNGTEKAFAERLQMSKSLLSQLKTSRNISDAIANQIETRCRKANGWLSLALSPAVSRPAPGEDAFVAMARAAYRAADKDGRTKLRAILTIPK